MKSKIATNVMRIPSCVAVAEKAGVPQCSGLLPSRLFRSSLLVWRSISRAALDRWAGWMGGSGEKREDPREARNFPRGDEQNDRNEDDSTVAQQLKEGGEGGQAKSTKQGEYTDLGGRW